MQQNHAPEVCWKPSRLLNDLRLSEQLILKLDEEKGITENTLVSRPSEVGGAEPKGDTEMKEGEDREAKEGEARETKEEEADAVDTEMKEESSANGTTATPEEGKTDASDKKIEEPLPKRKPLTPLT